MRRMRLSGGIEIQLFEAAFVWTDTELVDEAKLRESEQVSICG